ncbi:caspase family protein [Leptolyngbya boryana CZ1]|uniref:Caspase family protein n=1 Tax=Leptolyngbya boryana CZ1 TaxID=3060204 RepID=A0AA96WR97_LEPBY|nr:caspase family protein [Leptolyngbya boryana]WNZ44043.1 caspase family protein [Leptolyngbya boryana CZ1]
MAKVALLVGVSEYEPGLNPLPAAVKDVDAVQEVLLQPEIGGFAESDITSLKNPERQAMEEAIYTLFADRHRDDLVVLFFSGHGIKNDAGELFLATRGTRKTPRGELISPTAVSAKFIHDCMSRSRSRRQVVVLDSCFSGAFAEGLSAKDDGTVNIREQLGGEGRAILTSSSSTQYSFEEEGQTLSLYTRFLIEGIKTGQADQDGDDFISIDELHDYASRRVREVKPELKPELYAIREGFKIRLAQVAMGDPREKYRKEVARYGKRGDLTVVSRGILDTWRFKLGLSVDEAKALEDEVLEPHRQDFQQKLQRYEQVFTELLRRDETISDATRQELQNLQQILELRNEDTVKIEAKATARFKGYQQNLKTYEQAFSDTLRQEYPLTESALEHLRQMKQQLGLTDSDVAEIEHQITIAVEAYRQNLQQYEQLFLVATQQEYPLSEAKRQELRQQQHSLELTDSDVALIEAKITAQIETYHEKLQQYEQAFINATHRKHYPDPVQRSQLQQTWQALGLSEDDVKAIEARFIPQINSYQEHLQQYEQVFAAATQQQFPLSNDQQVILNQHQKALSLTDEDVAAIQSRIIVSIEEEQQKREQYRQVFAEAIQYENPLSEATRDELRQLQNILELSREEIEQVEAQVIEQSARTEKAPHTTEQSTKQTNEIQPQGTSNSVTGSTSTASRPLTPMEQEIARHKESTYQQNLQKYEREVSKKLKSGVPMNDGYIRSELMKLQRRLSINKVDAERIEADLITAKAAKMVSEVGNAGRSQTGSSSVSRESSESMDTAHTSSKKLKILASICITAAPIFLYAVNQLNGQNNASTTSQTDARVAGPGLPRFGDSIVCKCTSSQCTWFKKPYQTNQSVTVSAYGRNISTGDWNFSIKTPDGDNSVDSFLDPTKHIKVNGKVYEQGHRFKQVGITGLGAGEGWKCN